MGCAADRQEFRDALDNTKDHRLKDQPLHLDDDRHDHRSFHGVSEIFLEVL
jgi:hypothetical protein